MTDIKESHGLEVVAWVDSDQPDYITTDPELADRWVEDGYPIVELVRLSDATAVIDQLKAASREMAQTIIMLRADKDALVEALEDAIDYLNEPLNSIQHGSILYSQMCEALSAYRAAMEGSKGE